MPILRFARIAFSLSASSLTACALATTLIAPANAASTLRFTITEPGQEVKPQTVYIKNGKLLVRAAGGDTNIDLLYQVANQTITVIDHNERSIMPVNEKQLSQFVTQASGVMNMVQRQLAKQMEGMSEAEKEQFKSMLNQFGAGQIAETPESKKKVITITKGSIKVNGFDCQLTEVLEGNQVVTKLCFSDPNTLGITATDQQIVKGMLDMANKFRTHAVGMAQQFGANIPEFGTLDVQRIPIAMDQDRVQMRLIKIEATSPDFTLPTGYSMRQLPSLGL